MNTPVSKENAEHYNWAAVCDGWHLLKSDELSVIEERMPPGTSENRHYHEKSHQLFYILSGEATMEVAGEDVIVKTSESLYIKPFQKYQMKNNSSEELRFLVISSPKSHGDRVEC